MLLWFLLCNSGILPRTLYLPDLLQHHRWVPSRLSSHRNCGVGFVGSVSSFDWFWYVEMWRRGEVSAAECAGTWDWHDDPLKELVLIEWWHRADRTERITQRINSRRINYVWICKINFIFLLLVTREKRRRSDQRWISDMFTILGQYLGMLSNGPSTYGVISGDS